LKPGQLRLCLGEMGKERPAAFPVKPKPGELLVLHGGPEWQANGGAVEEEANLPRLIDQGLTAHGGGERLNKLQFTMTVKHSNAETQHYFVQPPRNLRWETTHRDTTSKRIVILFPEGRRWWRQEQNQAAVPFIPGGVEPGGIEHWLHYVKDCGPRQVLRLKDAVHKVTLLDEEVTVDGNAAVGVEVAGPRFKQTMYFDKKTHLLVKQGSVTYSDYKTFDGIHIAQSEHDGWYEPRVTDFRVVEKFDPKLFEKP